MIVPTFCERALNFLKMNRQENVRMSGLSNKMYISIIKNSTQLCECQIKPALQLSVAICMCERAGTKLRGVTS